jgi:predicted Fe-S protein YdhL (DUF1289 family)
MSDQPARKPDEVASPCIMVCRMVPEMGVCEGCFRTLDEIASWSRLSEGEKRAVHAQLPGRRSAHYRALISHNSAGSRSQS